MENGADDLYRELMIEKKRLAVFLSELPVVEMREGLPLVQRAEIVLANSEYRQMIYVAGQYKEDEQEYLVYGDNISHGNKVFNAGFTEIDAIHFSLIKKYTPLRGEKKEKAK